MGIGAEGRSVVDSALSEVIDATMKDCKAVDVWANTPPPPPENSVAYVLDLNRTLENRPLENRPMY